MTDQPKPVLQPEPVPEPKDKHVRFVATRYKGGIRYPHLGQCGEAPAGLDDICAPRRG